MALNVEIVVDGGVDREKALSRSGGLEALHFSLPSSDRLVGIFCSIVLPQPLLMFRRQPEFTERRSI